jgi:hypothetical protein
MLSCSLTKKVFFFLTTLLFGRALLCPNGAVYVSPG